MSTPRIILAAALAAAVPMLAPVNKAGAHPVIYQGGTVVMDSYQRHRNDFHAHYSFSSRLAAGLAYTSAKDADGERNEFVLGRVNWLGARRNRPNSQANLYLTAGAGFRTRGGHQSPAGLLGLQADYETPSFYTKFDGEALMSAGGHHMRRLRYRIGLAPYVADFDGLQTFVILDVHYRPDMGAEWSVGPTVRLFKGRFLVEAGIDFDGIPKLMLMYHH